MAKNLLQLALLFTSLLRTIQIAWPLTSAFSKSNRVTQGKFARAYENPPVNAHHQVTRERLNSINLFYKGMKSMIVRLTSCSRFGFN